MSCAVCCGHPGCPVCSPEPRMIDCPECGGNGCFTYYEEGEEMMQECECCQGEGMIEYDD